jgi:hypothetical protein
MSALCSRRTGASKPTPTAAAVGAEEKDGVFHLYQVRNFIVHQARNIPQDAETRLQKVVVEFAAFIPKILHTFNRVRLATEKSDSSS